jgi:hypothetical protein
LLVEEHLFHIAGDVLPDEVFLRITVAEEGEHTDLAAIVGDVVGDGQYPAGELLRGKVADGQDGFLGRCPDSSTVLVFVDDGITDYQHFKRFRVLQVTNNFSGRVTTGEAGQVFMGLFRQHRQIPVDEPGRAESDIIGESDFAADRFYRGLLVGNFSGKVGSGVFIIRPLHIEIRFKQLDGLDGGRPVVDGDIVDTTQGSDSFGPQLLGPLLT